MTLPTTPILLTGASGNLGRAVIPLLAEMGWQMRLTDIVPPHIPLPHDVDFVEADLSDESAILDAAEGMSGIVHLGAFVAYGSLAEVLDPNIRGIHSIFEAARQNHIRVVNASSNHVVGFYRRDEHLTTDMPMRPDSFYGLSKAYGELVARFYHDRHGVESVTLRIGSCFEEPQNERMLATWLSRTDLARLIDRSLKADAPGCAVIWGASANAAGWWGKDDRDRIGWQPESSADAWSGQFDPPGDAVADRYQGGKFCEMP